MTQKELEQLTKDVEQDTIVDRIFELEFILAEDERLEVSEKSNILNFRIAKYIHDEQAMLTNQLNLKKIRGMREYLKNRLEELK